MLPYREVADLEPRPGGDDELWATVTDAVRGRRRVFGPDGVNVGVNLGRPAGGSVPDHLHVHVVPRWTGDTNFMSSIANTQTMPEAWSTPPRKSATPGHPLRPTLVACSAMTDDVRDELPDDLDPSGSSAPTSSPTTAAGGGPA